MGRIGQKRVGTSQLGNEEEFLTATVAVTTSSASDFGATGTQSSTSASATVQTGAGATTLTDSKSTGDASVASQDTSASTFSASGSSSATGGAVTTASLSQTLSTLSTSIVIVPSLGSMTATGVSPTASFVITLDTQSFSPTAVTSAPQADAFADGSIIDGLFDDIQPTTSLIINAQKGGIGIEGAFVDALTSNVEDLKLDIKVAKTRVGGNPTLGYGATSVTLDALVQATNLVGLTKDPETTTTVSATVTDGTLVATLQESSSDAIGGEVADITGTALGGTLQTSAVAEPTPHPIAGVPLDAVFQNTSVTAQALAETAALLAEDGTFVNSQVEAAALVSQAVAEVLGTSESQSGADGDLGTIGTTDLTSRPTSEAIPDVDATDVNFSTIAGLFALVFTAMSGHTDVAVVTDQKVELMEKHNDVRIL